MTSQTIGDYELLNELGRGGMAVVYRARDVRKGNEVALKLMAEQLAGGEEALRRFQQEGRSVYGVRHPNVVPVLDVGVFNRQHYLVMEFVKGEPLQDVMKRFPTGLPLEEALRIAEGVANGLDHAHKRGLVHRDVKPANVMMTEDGVPRLADFGIARATAQTAVTQTGVALGTPLYMSPEQAQGKRVDGRSDIYSLGIMLFEMLTGHVPFVGEPLSVLMQHMQTPVPPVSQQRPDVPAEVSRIVARCLEKDPEKRFRSAGELALALHVAAQDLTPVPLHVKLMNRLPLLWQSIVGLSPVMKVGIGVGAAFVMAVVIGLSLPDSPEPSGGASPSAVVAAAASPGSTDAAPGAPAAVGPGAPLPASQSSSTARTPGSPGAAPSAPAGAPAAQAATPSAPVKSTAATPGHPSETPAGASAPAPVTTPGQPAVAANPGHGGEPAAAKVDTSDMVLIPAGSFPMGSSSGKDDEKPVHNVDVAPYFIDRTPVTVDKFRRFVKASGYQPEGTDWDMFEPALGNAAPVVNVTWTDANEYAKWAGRRLPTEAEWEKAARGQSLGEYAWGNTWSPTLSNWGDLNPLDGKMGGQDGYEKASPVGAMKSDCSSYGVSDVSGNVGNWTADWFQPYPGNTSSNPYFGQQLRVVRGGSWDSKPDDCRTTRRRGQRPHQGGPSVGFRTVLSQ